MAIKKYYWLKLHNDFFKSRAMKKLRRIAGGDTYTIIYLKLQLMSLKDEGHLFSEFIDDDIVDELAIEIDEEIENVRATLMFLSSCGLAEITKDEIVLPAVKISTGSETDSAVRVRRMRSRTLKPLQCNNEVTQQLQKSNDRDRDREEIEKKKSKKRDKKNTYFDFDLVKLTTKEFDKCIETYGEDQTRKAIEKLNSFIGSKGDKYKSHYHTLNSWVWDSVNATKLSDKKEVEELGSIF